MRTRKPCAEPGCCAPRESRSRYCGRHKGRKSQKGKVWAGCCVWEGCTELRIGSGNRYCEEHREQARLMRELSKGRKMRTKLAITHREAKDIKPDERLAFTVKFMLGMA